MPKRRERLNTSWKNLSTFPSYGLWCFQNGLYCIFCATYMEQMNEKISSSFFSLWTHMCASSECFSCAVDVAGLLVDMSDLCSLPEITTRIQSCCERVKFIACLAFLHRQEWRQIKRAVQEGSLRHWQMLLCLQDLCNLLYSEMNNKLQFSPLFCCMLIFLLLMCVTESQWHQCRV